MQRGCQLRIIIAREFAASDKIARVLNFKPKHTIEEAVHDLCVAFRAGKLRNTMSDDIYYNVRRMKNLRAA